MPFVQMLQTIGTPSGSRKRGVIYDEPDAQADEWIRRGLANPTDTPPPHIAQLLARLDDGAGRPCLFLPFVGEFGHLIMSHIRLVHFHRAKMKVVCCRPGQEALFPSATAFVYGWNDPIPDMYKCGSHREPIEWPELVAAHPTLYPVAAGGLTLEQERHPIRPAERIPFRVGQRRGLVADIVIGTRQRRFCPEKNWPHWNTVAESLRAIGFTVAVVGARGTAPDVPGQLFHTGDFDTAASIEALENCRLYLGTDSGASHLAAEAGARMVVFGHPDTASHRNLIGRMAAVNPGRVFEVPDGWNDAADVIFHALRELGAF